MKSFRDALKAGLEEHGVGFIAADVGRTAEGKPTWFVTINHPRAGLQSYQADFDAGTDLHATAALNSLIDRLVRAMLSTT